MSRYAHSLDKAEPQRAEVTAQSTPARAPAGAQGVLALQRKAGNRAVSGALRPSDAAPPIVHEALRAPGRPLDPETRAFMEPRFGQDFGAVRVHTDDLAAESARAVGALAYTAGQDVVFGQGQYAPQTTQGKRLLAHELAHVVQSAGDGTVQPTISRYDKRIETDAEKGAWEVSSGRSYAVCGTAPVAIRLKSDPQLEIVLELIRTIPTSFSTVDKFQYILRATSRLNLKNSDDLQPIIASMTGALEGNEQREVLSMFLAYVEESNSRKPKASGREPTLEEQLQMKRTESMLQVERRGSYGYGLGVALPAMSAAALSPVQALATALGNAGIFVSGLYEGLTQSINADQLRLLQNRLLASNTLTAVFPQLFLAGAGVGIVEDVVETIKTIHHTIVNFHEVKEAVLEVLGAMFKAEGADLARVMGLEVGRGYGQHIMGMLGENIFKFTIDLGRLIGPTVVYAVLAFLGIRELAIAAMANRLLQVLRPLLQRFPRLLRLADLVAARLSRRAHQRARYGREVHHPTPTVEPSAHHFSGEGKARPQQEFETISQQSRASTKTGEANVQTAKLAQGATEPRPAPETRALEFEDTGSPSDVPPLDHVMETVIRGSQEFNPEAFRRNPGKKLSVKTRTQKPLETLGYDKPRAKRGYFTGSRPSLESSPVPARWDPRLTIKKDKWDSLSPQEQKKFVDEWMSSHNAATVKAKPLKPEKRARPSGDPFEQKKSELGEGQETEAVTKKKTAGGGSEPRSTQAGKWIHKNVHLLPNIIKDVLRKGDARAAELIKALDLEWPSDVKPNVRGQAGYYSIITRGGRLEPDGIDWKSRTVYELKPDTESEWARRGPSQLQNYVDEMNKLKYLGGKLWEGKILTYNADVLIKLLDKWQYLEPKKRFMRINLLGKK